MENYADSSIPPTRCIYLRYFILYSCTKPQDGDQNVLSFSNATYARVYVGGTAEVSIRLPTYSQKALFIQYGRKSLCTLGQLWYLIVYQNMRRDTGRWMGLLDDSYR